MDGWMDGWMDGSMAGWLLGLLAGCLVVCILSGRCGVIYSFCFPITRSVKLTESKKHIRVVAD
uniref:Transmembrane protein n=1 Tax=Glossina palpalis gambiensis TaxID=67801 RepID=A0A1B0AWH4_9MUSC